MKKLLLMSLVAIMALQSCNKSDDNQDNVSKQAKMALMSKYPDANNVVWQTKSSYVVATFTSLLTKEASQNNLDAWFDNNGSWYMTEINTTFDNLPEAVKTGFLNSIYAQWKVEDVDKIERNGTEVIYVIEVEQNNKEMDLYFSTDGVLTKEMADMDNDYDYEDYIPSNTTSTVDAYINANYPQARILEIDNENQYIEVEILDGTIKRELLFNNNGNWVRTKTEVAVSGVPVNIMTTLKESEYGSYRIDDIDHYIKPQSEYYLFELKSGSGDVNVEITTALVLTVVNNDNDFDGTVNKAYADFIANKYAGAKIIDIDHEGGYLEVEIIHDGRKKEVRFNAASEWIDTSMDVKENELPTAVKKTLAESAYAQYEIDDVEFIQTPKNEYYRIELENNNKDIVMQIKLDGTLL